MSKLNNTMRLVLTLVALIGVIGVAYGVYQSITTEIKFVEGQKTYNNSVIQKMKDIRGSRKAFAKIHNKYTSDISGEL